MNLHPAMMERRRTQLARVLADPLATTIHLADAVQLVDEGYELHAVEDDRTDEWLGWDVWYNESYQDWPGRYRTTREAWLAVGAYLLTQPAKLTSVMRPFPFFDVYTGEVDLKEKMYADKPNPIRGRSIYPAKKKVRAPEGDGALGAADAPRHSVAPGGHQPATGTGWQGLLSAVFVPRGTPPSWPAGASLSRHRRGKGKTAD